MELPDMPASNLPAPVTPAAPSAPRTSPSAGRDTDGTDGQFGRQLDAARGRQDGPATSGGKADGAAGKRAGAAQSGTTPAAAAATPDAAAPAPGPAGAAAAVVPQPAAADVVAGQPGDDEAHARHDDDADDGLAQIALSGLLPVFGAALPGAMAHRGGLASSAGVELSAHAAVASGIADAARMLLAQAANAPVGDGGTDAGTGTSVASGLQAVLSAVRGAGTDDAQAGAGITTAANLPAAQLATLPALGAGTHMLAMAAPLGSDGFHQELATQVNWLAGQDVKQARIRIHPEDLGPIDLKVSVSHDHVDVVFSVQHPGTVQALQQSLPQLGQMLAQHGLSLGHAEVGQHGGNNASTPRHGGTTALVDEPAELQISGIRTITGAPNLLDAFA
jgi:flagellar hook-length control protein FliK